MPDPYIDDQFWSLLVKFDQPKAYLETRHLRAGRHGTRSSGPADEESDSPWLEVEHLPDIVENHFRLPDGNKVDLSRMVITTDAGIGKSTSLKWLESQLNRPRSGRLAIYLKCRDLNFSAAGYHDNLVSLLAERIHDITGDECSLPSASQIVLSSLRTSRLILLIDGIDQAGDAVGGLTRLLHLPQWKGCRIIIAARPYALQKHWSGICEHIPWRFFKLGEFDSDQQRRYLGEFDSGESLYDALPEDARTVLSVPRVLHYIRELAHSKSSDWFQKELNTAADVYYYAIDEMIKRGLQESADARLVGWEGTEPPEKPQSQNVREAWVLLSTVAYLMTCRTTVTPLAEVVEFATTPNFDRIDRSFFYEFDALVRSRYKSKSRAGLGQDWQALAALNDILEHGVFDTDLVGIQEIEFRNRSLQEFLCACYLARFASTDDARRLWNWIYQPELPESEQFYPLWQFLCDMPEQMRSVRPWLNAISPLYRVGDGTVTGTKRSNEMIYRSWGKLNRYCRALVPEALALRDGWWSEFEDEIVSNRQGAARGATAKEFQDSFLTLPSGEFEMGSLPGRVRVPDSLRAWAEQFLRSAPGDPADWNAHIETSLEGVNFGRGKPALRQRESWKNRLRRMLEAQSLDALTELYPNDESQQTQKIASFELGRQPALNAWYRLYVPGHGIQGPGNPAAYEQTSPSPRHPAVWLGWYDGWAFAMWARWNNLSCRLPFENEWEYAAKFRTPDEWNYWWGDTFDPSRCNAANDEGRSSIPTVEHANPSTQDIDHPRRAGLQDMLGNVWEWCQDRYRRVYCQNSLDIDSDVQSSSRVVRGSSFINFPVSCRSACRNNWAPANADFNCGVRVARALS